MKDPIKTFIERVDRLEKRYKGRNTDSYDAAAGKAHLESVIQSFTLEKIIEQFEMVGYHDDIGHPLANNVAFIALKRLAAQPSGISAKKLRAELVRRVAAYQARYDNAIKQRKASLAHGYSERLLVCESLIADLDAGAFDDAWIPVSEQLPDDPPEHVLITLWDADEPDYQEVDYARFDGDSFTFAGTKHKATGVIAWQPLPKPYVPSKGDAEGK